MKSLAQRVVDILDKKANAGSRPAQRNWYGFENANGTDIGSDIESLIKQAKNILKQETL